MRRILFVAAILVAFYGLAKVVPGAPVRPLKPVTSVRFPDKPWREVKWDVPWENRVIYCLNLHGWRDTRFQRVWKYDQLARMSQDPQIRRQYQNCVQWGTRDIPRLLRGK